MPNESTSNKPAKAKPLDYLVIGHVTADLTASGVQMGGTAAFSALTAQSLGLKCGVITSHGKEIDTNALKQLWVKNKPSKDTTTFKNISDGRSRKQYLYKTAEYLKKSDIPTLDPPPGIVHLGPIANEIDPEILQCFPNSLKCLTPQGWFRTVDDQNQVVLQSWKNSEQYLAQADAAVISMDDVQKDEAQIAAMANSVPVFVVTENIRGARVYWHNDARFINAPEVKYEDDTGAGDIFAAAFFYRYFYTKDPWEAGRFAVLLASWSVTRKYLDSIPTSDEIDRAKMELIDY